MRRTPGSSWTNRCVCGSGGHHGWSDPAGLCGPWAWHGGALLPQEAPPVARAWADHLPPGVWDPRVHRTRGHPASGIRQAGGLVGHGHHSLRVPGGLCALLWRHSRRALWTGHQWCVPPRWAGRGAWKRGRAQGLMDLKANPTLHLALQTTSCGLKGRRPYPRMPST